MSPTCLTGLVRSSPGRGGVENPGSHVVRTRFNPVDRPDETGSRFQKGDVADH